MKPWMTIIVLVLISNGAISQEKGFLRGNIGDGDFGGPMIGAAITPAGMPGVGTISDFDGNYSLPMEPGTYTFNVSFISYATLQFPNVVIKPGEVTILDAVMRSSIEELAAVEVVAEVKRNTEVAMLMEIKNATNVTDGLGAQSFRKIGDSELGGAIRRVTGVTVQGGKYVYVRGLGDRYTKTLLNGMEIPGLDPDVNSVQIDIFPTAVLENVGIFKTFSPDLFGDFTGGLINVITKSFPDEKTSQISLSTTYIAGQSFNPDYLLYTRGNLDWAGYDDGSRKLNIDKKLKIPNVVLEDPITEEVTRSFNPELAVKSKTALPTGSFSYNHGNQINREGKATLGYNAVFNYSNEHIYYDEFQSNDYLKNEDFSENQLFKRVTRTSQLGKNNVQWSGLLSGSIKKDRNKLSLIILNSQSGEATAAKRINQDFNQNQSKLVEDVLTYTQRTLSTAMLLGSHRIGILEAKWSLASSYSQVYDPDFRETRLDITLGDSLPALRTGSGAGIDRFWRRLREFNEGVKLDVKIPVAEKAEILTGLSGVYKTRQFEVLSYKHRRTDLSDVTLDPDWLLQSENIWSADPSSPSYDNGTFTLGNFQPANTYDATQLVLGGYAMAQHTLLKKLKLVYGARVEKADMYYTGESNSGLEVYDREHTLDELNFLPSVNVVYGITDKMNLRLAANQTLARPSFKEKSIAQIYDPITKRTFVGNLDLQATSINNFDLRYEYYFTSGEVASVAGFYKQFDGHIELVSFATAPDNLKPRNSGQAQVYGVEMEIRKRLALKSELAPTKGLYASVNGTLVQSAVDLKSVFVDEEGTTEFDLRSNNLRVGETQDQFRPMAGQSPYAINASLSYENQEKQLSISAAYNVQGDQLSVIASGRVPDVYTLAFHSLNMNAYKSFGEKMNHRLTLGLGNLLDDDRVLVYRSYNADDEIYTSYKPGRTVSLRYTYDF